MYSNSTRNAVRGSIKSCSNPHPARTYGLTRGPHTQELMCGLCVRECVYARPNNNVTHAAYYMDYLIISGLEGSMQGSSKDLYWF